MTCFSMMIFVQMNNFKGKYYIQGGAEHAATFVFLKDKLSIKFNDENNNGREVFWYYDEIKKDAFNRYGNCTVRYNGYPEQTIETSSPGFAEQIEIATA